MTSRFKLLVDERLLSHNLIVGAGTILAGLLGVAFQSLVSHQLPPADFGAVFVVVTLITFIGMPASAFTLLMARQASRDRASGNFDHSATVLRDGNRILLLTGTAIAAVLAIGAPMLAGFVGAPQQLIVAAAVGVPFGVALPLLLGELQGEQRFGIFAFLAVGQATLKLTAAMALGLIFGPVGVILGISAASVAAYFVALSLVRSKRAGAFSPAWFRPAGAYLAVIMPSTLAMAMLLSTDVVLVKHYFGHREAGEYSAVAALGRAIFWGASGIAAVLFPKVVFRSAKGDRASLVVIPSLILVAVGGLAALGLLLISSGWLLAAFAGPAYRAAAMYLPWYAIGMVFLGATAVLVATHQSHGRAEFLAVLVPSALLEPILIASFHHTLTQVIQVVDLSMGTVAAALGVLYVVQERAGRFATGLGPGIVATQMSPSR